MNDQSEQKLQRSAVQWVGDRILGLSAAALTLTLASTVIGLFAQHHWVADIFTNLRMQQVIGLIGAGTALAIGRKWKWLAVALVLLCVHLPWFATAFSSASNDAESSQSELVVMTANVLTSNTQHDEVLKQINSADADVFAILELGTPLHLRLEEELSSAYPHRVTLPQDGGNFGIGLYSRHSLSDIDSFSTNENTIKSIGATVKTDSASYRIIATHPLPPMGQGGFQSRNEHMQILAQRVSKLRSENRDMPVIVMGDLNLTPWSPMFQKFETDSGLTLAKHGNDIVPTWYTKPFFPFGLVLDHVLLSDDLRCVHREIGPDIGSDHRAVIVAIADKGTE